MFSQTAEYALRAITFMAMHSERPFAVVEIAQKTQIPQAYLAKVLQAVNRAGLVTSKRGLNGGFLLSRPPDQMTVLDVINAVDPIVYGDRCPLGLEMHGNALCSIHEKLRIAYSAIEEIFSQTKISDLLEKPACTIDVRKRCSKKS